MALGIVLLLVVGVVNLGIALGQRGHGSALAGVR
jgi:tungstate transport system permease protein